MKAQIFNYYELKAYIMKEMDIKIEQKGKVITVSLWLEGKKYSESNLTIDVDPYKSAIVSSIKDDLFAAIKGDIQDMIDASK